MNLDTYKAEYEQAMAQQGVKVVWNEDGVPGGVPSVGGYNNPDNWVATLSRDGVSVNTLVTLGRISVTGMTAQELAQQDIQFALRYTGQVNSPQGNVPSPFFEPIDDDTRRFYEMYPERRPGALPLATRPGPATTVPTGEHSSIARQQPPTPNDGTVVRPPSAAAAAGAAPAGSTAMLTFWQWNYYNQQATGREGPDPADVGVPNGNQLMTGAQWVAAIGNYFGAPVAIPPTNGGVTAGVGATPTGGGVAVGGTGTGVGSQPPVGSGGAGAGAGGAGAGAGPAGPVRRSFWEWNAIKEQSTGIVGDDPSHYGINGADLMTLADWSTLTAAYYASKQTPGATTPKDDTLLLLLAAGAVVFLIAGNRG